MKTAVCTAMVVFSLTLSLDAQQAVKWKSLDGPEEGYIASSLIASDGVWWAGAWGGAFASTDQGRTWQRRELKAHDVNDIIEFPNGTLWAATSAGLVRTSDGGTNWTNLYPYGQYRVRALQNGTIVIGSGSGVMYSTDGGKNFWQAGNGLTDRNILSMLVHPSGRFFVGTHSGIFFCDTIGSIWTHVSDPATRHYCDAMVVTPGGRIYASFYNNPICLSTDNGTSWTALPNMPTLGYTQGLATRSELSLVMSVDFGSGCGHGDIPPGGTRRGLYLTSDAGASWTSVSNGLDEPKIRTLTEARGGEWFLGTTRGVNVSRNDLQGWNESNSGMNAFLAYSIAPGGAEKLFVSGSTGAMRSLDGGRTWKNISKGLPDSYVHAIAYGNDGYLYCAPYSDTVWVSTNDGETWERGSSTSDRNILVTDLVVDRIGTVYAVREYDLGIAISRDHGKTWSIVLPDLWCSDVIVGRNGEVMAVMEDNVYRTTDAGYNWTFMNDALLYNKRTILRTQQGTLLLSNYDGDIERSTDEGRSWTTVYSAGWGWIDDLVEVDGRIYANPIWTGVVCSTDDGVTWFEAADGLDNTFPTRLSVSNNGTLYLGTWGGGLYVSGTSITVERPAPVPMNLELHQNFPNPVSSTTIFSYTLRRAEHIRIEIHDAIGRRVSTLFDGEQEKGTHVLQWNTEELPCGQYHCCITSERETASRSLTIVR